MYFQTEKELCQNYFSFLRFWHIGHFFWLRRYINKWLTACSELKVVKSDFSRICRLILILRRCYVKRLVMIEMFSWKYQVLFSLVRFSCCIGFLKFVSSDGAEKTSLNHTLYRLFLVSLLFRVFLLGENYGIRCAFENMLRHPSQKLCFYSAPGLLYKKGRFQELISCFCSSFRNLLASLKRRTLACLSCYASQTTDLLAWAFPRVHEFGLCKKFNRVLEILLIPTRQNIILSVCILCDDFYESISIFFSVECIFGERLDSV